MARFITTFRHTLNKILVKRKTSILRGTIFFGTIHLGLIVTSWAEEGRMNAHLSVGSRTLGTASLPGPCRTLPVVGSCLCRVGVARGKWSTDRLPFSDTSTIGLNSGKLETGQRQGQVRNRKKGIRKGKGTRKWKGHRKRAS